MKLKIIKVLSLLLIIWILLCFSLSLYLYMSKPPFGPSNLERADYGPISGQPRLDEIDLTINEVKEGDFFGFATLVLKTEEAKKAYSEADRSYILLGGVHASSSMLQFPNWIDLETKNKAVENPVLVTREQVKIYDSGDDFSYPFDSYLVELSFDFQLYYGEGYEKFEKKADSATVLFDLPRNYVVSRLSQIPNISCDYTECDEEYLDSVHENEFLHKVTRAPWLQWFTLGIIAVIFAPIILLVNAKVESINIDILASLISILAIRAFLLGTTTKFYALDFVFGIAALLVVLIPMIKIIALRDGTQKWRFW